MTNYTNFHVQITCQIQEEMFGGDPFYYFILFVPYVQNLDYINCIFIYIYIYVSIVRDQIFLHNLLKYLKVSKCNILILLIENSFQGEKQNKINQLKSQNSGQPTLAAGAVKSVQCVQTQRNHCIQLLRQHFR